MLNWSTRLIQKFSPIIAIEVLNFVLIKIMRFFYFYDIAFLYLLFKVFEAIYLPYINAHFYTVLYMEQ